MIAGFWSHNGGNRNYLRNLRARTTHKGVLRPSGGPLTRAHKNLITSTFCLLMRF
jgi:hypothetical protein